MTENATAGPDPRNEWEVVELAHTSTGQTVGDDGTGDEWVIERANANYPAARVVTTYAVTKRALGDDGEFLDISEVADEAAHPSWRYAVEEQTELLASTAAGEDFWAGTVETLGTERGEGSFRDYDTEEEADNVCRNMAQHDAAISGAITWDGKPLPA